LKTIITLFIFCFILTGVTLSCSCQSYHPSKGEQLVNSTLAKTAKIIKGQYPLHPCGSGASMPGGPIRKLALCFDTKYPLTKEQLRELLIKTGNELVIQVNENQEIQPFLKEPPFTIKNVQIIIYNHDKEGKRLYDPQIATAQIYQGTFTFRTVDPEDTFKYKSESTETYEEALKLYKNEFF